MNALQRLLLISVIAIATLTGCIAATNTSGDVTLHFALHEGDQPVICGQTYQGFGTEQNSIELLDARIYLSNIRLITIDGQEVPLQLSADGKWQSDQVALVDFEDSSALCADGGTAETNATVKGSVALGYYTGIVFDMGVPFELNHQDVTMARAPLNVPALWWNWQYGYSTYTWANPLLTELERQLPIPMFGEAPVELGITGNETQVLARLQRDARYRRLFAAAFPADKDPFTWQRITQALASFTRTLISGNSAYDRYKAGDPTALSPAAQRGQRLFFSERLECHHCHTGFNLTASTYWDGASFAERAFFNTGLYNLDGKGAYPNDNTGIYGITTKATDMGKFRPPTLRNIALTAPYMHDGSVATLEEVIRIYETGGRLIEEGELAGDGRKNPYKSGFLAGVKLSDEERTDLVAFLNSLTDEQFVTEPRFSDPFVPTVLPTLVSNQ